MKRLVLGSEDAKRGKHRQPTPRCGDETRKRRVTSLLKETPRTFPHRNRSPNGCSMELPPPLANFLPGVSFSLSRCHRETDIFPKTNCISKHASGESFMNQSALQKTKYYIDISSVGSSWARSTGICDYSLWSLYLASYIPLSAESIYSYSMPPLIKLSPGGLI